MERGERCRHLRQSYSKLQPPSAEVGDLHHADSQKANISSRKCGAWHSLVLIQNENIKTSTYYLTVFPSEAEAEGPTRKTLKDFVQYRDNFDFSTRPKTSSLLGSTPVKSLNTQTELPTVNIDLL